jgi:DNA-directed RNA polymerase alpha subunit
MTNKEKTLELIYRAERAKDSASFAMQILEKYIQECNANIAGFKLGLLDAREAILNKPFNELEISVRTANSIMNDNNGVYSGGVNGEPSLTVGDIVAKKHSYYLRTPNFGRKSLKDLIDALSNIGVIWHENGGYSLKKIGEPYANT